jgi:hypothetical protein
MHVFVEVLFWVFILYHNEELSRMFICGIFVAPKVSQVLGELTGRIEMEKKVNVNIGVLSIESAIK